MIAPPPAWIETPAKSRWLAYGSYCWKTTCVDMIPPQSRPDLPSLGVAHASTARVHLGIAPTSISVSISKVRVRVRLDAAKRTLSWRATRGGIAVVSVRGSGDASYVIRLRVH